MVVANLRLWNLYPSWLPTFSWQLFSTKGIQFSWISDGFIFLEALIQFFLTYRTDKHFLWLFPIFPDHLNFPNFFPRFPDFLWKPCLMTWKSTYPTTSQGMLMKITFKSTRKKYLAGKIANGWEYIETNYISDSEKVAVVFLLRHELCKDDRYLYRCGVNI